MERLHEQTRLASEADNDRTKWVSRAVIRLLLMRDRLSKHRDENVRQSAP